MADIANVYRYQAQNVKKAIFCLNGCGNKKNLNPSSKKNLAPTHFYSLI